jgi:hypothetical protein
MKLSEKRNDIYSFLYDRVVNKKLDKKEWYKLRAEFTKLLKGYSDETAEPQIVYKEKIVYKDKIKKPEEDNYWGI